MKCYLDECNSSEASHYVNVIYSLDGRWVDEGTNYGDEYTCEEHISKYIESFTGQPGVEVLEVEVKKLGR